MSQALQQYQQMTDQSQNLSLRAPSQLPSAVNAGAVAIEQERAIAEAQGQLVLAKRFPRDLNAAYAELMVACQSKAFAEVAFYTVQNRGSGPTIRFAEEVARVFGNFQYGHRELARGDGKSEIEVYAWDMEKNNRSIRQITVKHVRDTRNGAIPLRDEADIDNKIANVASKQVRGRILALMPKWFVEEAVQQCKKTLLGASDESIEVRIRRMVQAFSKHGVSIAHLEGYLGHPMDKTLPDEIVELTGVFNALKEGAKASEFFGDLDAEQKAEQAVQAAEAVQQAAKATPAPRRRRGAVADLQQAREARQVQQEAQAVEAEPEQVAEQQHIADDQHELESDVDAAAADGDNSDFF